MALVDRRFYFIYEDGDKLYPQLYASDTDESRWVFHVSPARNALGHGKEAKDLKELKYYCQYRLKSDTPFWMLPI